MTNLDDPTPINFGNPGCPAMVRSNVGQWASCSATPEFAGYVDVTRYVEPDRRGTYRLFPCREHRDLVRDTRPMTGADRAERAYRREQEARALAGLPYERVGPVKDHQEES